MMSAAILLSAVGEQTKVLSESADHGSADKPSFARSLAKQFKDSELIQIESTPVSSPHVSQNLSRETETKRSEEVGEMPTGLKTAASVLEPGATLESSKIATAEKAATQPLKTAVAQSARNVEGESRVGQDNSGETQISDRDVLSAAHAASDGFAAAPGESPSPRVELSENKPTSASPAATFIITKAVVEPAGSPKEMAARGSVKADKSEISQKRSPKSTGSDVTGKSSSALVDTGNVAGSIALVAAPPPAADDATANNSGKAADLKIVELLPSAGSSGVRVVPISVKGTVHSEAAVATMSHSDAAAMPSNQDVAYASLKAGLEGEKVAAPIVQLGDGGRAPQREPGSTVPFAHFAAGTVEGIVTATPGIVAAGSPLGNSVTAKVPGGEPSLRSTAVQVPLNEQPGASMLTMPMDGAPRMLSATPNALEVGIQDGAHGWVRVRAEMTDGGSVNALVSAASPQGQEMLHRELPSLTAYLQQEKVTVNSVVVHVPVQAAVEVRDSAGLNGGNDQMSRRGSEGGGQRQYAERPASDVPERTMTYRTEGVDEDGLLQIGRHSASGGWLSVRA